MSAPLPNIVVILADDLGYGDLGCYNPASKIPTIHHAASGKFAIRLGEWVFIDAPSGNDNGKGEPESLRPPAHRQPGELFSLKDDLSERTNRYAEQPRRVAELKARLERARSEGRTAPKRPIGS